MKKQFIENGVASALYVEKDAERNECFESSLLLFLNHVLCVPVRVLASIGVLIKRFSE